MNCCAACVFLAAASGLFGQSNTTKTAPAKPDTWERSKECATQAEKIMAEYNRDGAPASHWENHYSSKYNRCFILTTKALHPNARDGKYGPVLSIDLIDAFERSVLANRIMGGSTEPYCHIEDKPTDCATVEGFVSEHMKN